MHRPPALVAAALVCAASPVFFLSRAALAQEHSIIKRPGDHPSYVFEAEPHLVLGWAGPFFADSLPGAGFRGTFEIANGFIRSINDSVGVGVGLDVVSSGHVVVPVVLQWNFWLSTHWSVFGEPGIVVGNGLPNPAVSFAFFVGGRFHITDRVALTLRLGYPELSVGVSFLL